MIVSVLVPTYNRPEGLARALESLAQQTMPLSDFEVLVLNDGGIPPKRTAPKGLCVKWYDLPHRGQSATINHGVSVAKGKYITVAHDDDLVLPDKLKVLSAALDTLPDIVGAVFGLARYTTRKGDPAATPPHCEQYAREHPIVTADTISAGYGLHVHGTSTMYRADAVRAVGPWDEQIQTAEEYDYHLRMLDQGWEFHAVPVEVVTYADGGKSRKYRRSTTRSAALQRIYAKLTRIKRAS